MANKATQQDIDITKVTPQQLVQLSKAFEEEIQSLAASYNQLNQAVQKFTDSKLVLNYLKERSANKEILVPLTSSLYVPGRMENNN